MASRDENERSLYQVVADALRSWLTLAKEAVMGPWNRGRVRPDPTAVYGLQGQWDFRVDTILTRIGQIAMDAWSEVTDAPPVSRHAFVMAELAKVRNLLVRVPDEVADLVFAEITDGVNAGETVDQVAARVDRVLSWTGSENWPSRAKTIAVTETTRAYGYGILAAGLEVSRVTGRQIRKRWDSEGDLRVRPAHEAVNGATVGLSLPFYVGGEPLLYPGDPTGRPDLVINCRCDLRLVNEVGR